MHPRSFATGAMSYIPGLFEWWDDRRPMGNTADPAYCRNIWRFHRDNALQASPNRLARVGEIGPGATLGVCIAALLDGVDQAVAIDAGHYAKIEANVGMLRSLTEGDGASFDRLRDAVAAARDAGPAAPLKYVAPWSDRTICALDSLDLIFSHSVLEHVSDPAATYAACFSWLKAGGIMSHKIDHSSHALTRSWNGHYEIPDVLWTLIYGRRPYLLNRWRPARHLSAFRAAGFEILASSRFVIGDGLDTEVTLDAWPDDDRLVRTSTIIARKP
ncbi:methyltransferase domain-containing protein [Brevundimonas sp.]|uniref:methyltransferase domain-containing protein n=1 Tax=Brevundimonas sp. TaxID=1871086 RepID=UPI00286D1A37|nr:methyltransferase domain-containing protein [Brevundimonas sp.]